MAHAAVLTSTEPSLVDEIRASMGSVGRCGRRYRLSPGRLVSLDGAHAGLHLLLEGRVKTLRFTEDGRVMILDLLEAGDVFGEMSLVADDIEPTYFQALDEVEIESLPRFAMEQALLRRPSLALGIARLVGARRNRLERRLESQVFQKVPERLASLLLELAERFGAEVPDGTVLDIPLSQQDLGNLIGGSREIVSLTLSELRRRGAVSMMGRRIVVNEEELRRQASLS